MEEVKTGSRFLSPTVSICLLIVGLLFIPLVMEWRNLDIRHIKIVGRVCGGVAAGLSIYGVTTNALKILGICAGSVITLTVLVSEGLINLPKF